MTDQENVAPAVDGRAELDGAADLRSERLAPTLLPRVLTTTDLAVLLVAVVLFITNAAVIQTAGPAAFGWWILGFMLFLAPAVIVTGQLGRMFPGEGSIYLWTHKAFGPFWGFFAGFCAWWPGVLVMVATATLVLAFLEYIFPAQVGGLDVTVQGLAIAGLIAISGAVSMMRLRVTQNLLNIVVGLYGVAVVLIGLAGVAWLLGGHSAVTDPLDLGAYAPSASTGLNLGNWTFFGLVVLALLGVEVPLNLGAEVAGPRSITRYLVFGSIAVVAAYLVATFGVMVVVPADGSSADVVAVAQAVALGLGQPLGQLVAAILATTFLLTTVAYNYTHARLIFVSGLDRRLPPTLARLNARSVPANAIWAQTIVAGAVALLIYDVLPAIGFGGGSPVDAETRVYEILQAAVTIIWCLSVLFLFVDVVVAVRRYPRRFEAVRVAPRWVLAACALVGGLAALVAIVSTLSEPWTPLVPNDTGTIDLLGATVSYGEWSSWIVGLALVSLAVGAALYGLGRRPTSAVDEPGAGTAG